MRIIRWALAAVFAVLAFSAMAASGANAATTHPLFLTLSGNELLVLGEGSVAVLRGLNLGVLGTITCEKSLVHGWVLNKSPLIHRLKILFHTKCQQTINGTTTACTEPIHVKELLGELGLLLQGTTKVVGIRLEPSDGTKLFVRVECNNGANITSVEGAIIGEIPAATSPYNVPLEEIETVFASENKNENQKYTIIDLLGVEDTKVELKVEGFFGGKASEEAKGTLHGDGLVEICTKAPSACP